MTNFLLTHCILEYDVTFLNETPIEWEFIQETPNDSGWCDATTGLRVLSSSDRIIFTTQTAEDEALLKWRYDDRLHEIESK